MRLIQTAAILLAQLLVLPAVPSVAHQRPGETRDAVIIDSNLSFAEAVGRQKVPAAIKSQLRLVNVRYYSFDGRLHQGQLVIHKSLQANIIGIFQELAELRFPLAKVIPISRYNYSDNASMLDNNTSAFNYRRVAGTRVLSNHATGRAIDINPFLNPLVQRQTIVPAGARYDPQVAGTITRNGAVRRAFKKRGWRWGGDWRSKKDYQHFEKL